MEIADFDTSNDDTNAEISKRQYLNLG